MNPKLIDVRVLQKHLSGVVSNLEHFSTNATKRERKLLMSVKQNENLNEQHTQVF